MLAIRKATAAAYRRDSLQALRVYLSGFPVCVGHSNRADLRATSLFQC